MALQPTSDPFICVGVDATVHQFLNENGVRDSVEGLPKIQKDYVYHNTLVVSLTSILDKLFEKIMLAHIQEGPAGDCMLTGNQHGFISGRSCQTNLVAFYEQITKSLDAGVAVDIVLLDFRKALDTVSHPVLIKKLGDCGVDTYTVKWVAN